MPRAAPSFCGVFLQIRTCFEDLLNLGGFESLIHEKGARIHPLSDAAKELNRIKSSIRAFAGHIFCCMTMSMGGKLTRKTGLERNDAWWGLKNLTFNILRYLQRSSHIEVVPVQRPGRLVTNFVPAEPLTAA